jgi:hypothetical protein
MGRPMRKQSESLLLLPLLPIFLVGMFPILLIGLLGFFGLAMFGVLMVSVGLTSGLEAHSHFNEEIIIHGFARNAERGVQASDLQQATHFAVLLEIAGLALIVAGGVGFYYYG